MHYCPFCFVGTKICNGFNQLLYFLLEHTSNVSRLSENRDSQAFGSEHTSASNLCFFPVTPRDPDFKHFRPISWLSNLTYYLHSTFNVLTAAFSSAESLLYCLALSLFVITMICSLRYRSFHKSLTPGRHFFQLRESATTHGFVLLLFILVYFASRFLLACKLGNLSQAEPVFFKLLFV